MTHKKPKKIWPYWATIILLFIAFFVEKSFISVGEKAMTIKPKSSQTSTNTSTLVTIKPPFLADETTHQQEDTYEVTETFIEQHVFDEHICTSEDTRILFAKQQTEMLNVFERHYQKHSYQINNVLTLNLYGTNLTKYFKEQLYQRLKALHLQYITMLGDSAALTEITLHLIIVAQRFDYDTYLAGFMSNPEKSLGVYFSGINLAFVDYQGGDENALSTAIHESVHGLNAHIIGRTPLMFNEGMAEFYETLKLDDNDLKIMLSEQRLALPSYPVMQFFDNEQWAFLNWHQLYRSSWSWVAFMSNSHNDLSALIHYMKQEQQTPCEAFSAGETYSILSDKSPYFESEYYHWLQQYE